MPMASEREEAEKLLPMKERIKRAIMRDRVRLCGVVAASFWPNKGPAMQTEIGIYLAHVACEYSISSLIKATEKTGSEITQLLREWEDHRDTPKFDEKMKRAEFLMRACVMTMDAQLKDHPNV